MKTLGKVLAVWLVLAVPATLFVGCNVAVDPGTGGGDGGGGTPMDPAEFTSADGLKGGAFYDKFYADGTGFDQTQASFETVSAAGDFFRCKQCHGWDHLGNMGAYINRAPKATRPNVSGVNLAEHVGEEEAQELFETIKTGHGAPRRMLDADLSTYDPEDPTTTADGDMMPDFSEIFSDEEIWNIVKYLKDELLDTTQLYDITTDGTYPDGTRTFSNIGKDGDAANGDSIYAAKCAGCHGADGVGGSFPVVDDGVELSIGAFARDKPYELWHKVKFGNPGSVMTAQGVDSLSDMKDLLKALADSDAYPDADAVQ